MRPAPPPARGLRVGVVLGDSLIAERVLRAPGRYSIGQSIHNSLPLPLPGLPRRWTLLEVDQSGLRLRLPRGADARVSLDGRILTRADLEAMGTRRRTGTVVALGQGCRGRVDLGEVRVLFQEVAVAAPAPIPALPRAVRGTLSDRIDPRLAALVAASLLVHVGIMTAAHFNDPPAASGLAERAMADYQADTTVIHADQLAFLDPPATPDDPDDGDDGDDGDVDDGQPGPPAPATAPTRSRPERPAPSGRPTPDQPVAEPGTDATRYADLLFSDDPGGTTDAGMARRRPGADLDRQLDEARDANARVSIGGDGDRLRDGGGPRLGTSHEPVLDTPDGPTRVQPDKHEATPPVRIHVVPPPRPPPGDANGLEQVIAKIQTTYMPGLERCYKKSLLGAPELSGKVKLAFTLTERGSVEDGSATGVDPLFEQCVEGLMTRWSFTPVTDRDGGRIDLDVSLSLALRPS